MATTYTTNYNLGKQENHADKFDMDVITDNADKIDAALTAKADKSTTYTKTEVDTALSGKQATLTTAQLAAVNSGIDSTKVTQIDTNKNNISFLTANGGGKNKLNLIISEIKSLNTSGTWAGDTYTRNGVDFTINSDYSITVNASSAATALATFELKINTPTFTTATTLSGCPSGGNYDSTYALYTTDSNGNTTARDTGSGVDITNKSIAKIRILVRGGYKPTNLIFKPMICDTAIYNSEKTYQPHALSNAELTAKEQVNENNISLLTEQVDFLSGKMVYSRVGNSSYTATYTMNKRDFDDSQVGLYLIYIVNWSATPSISIYAMAYSGNLVSQATLTKIFGSDVNISLVQEGGAYTGAVTYTGAGKIQIVAVR